MSSSPHPGARFGDFEITRELGRGASGVVYAAVQLGLGREVALKLLSPELVDDVDHRRRFEREAQALARIDSPHVIGVHAAGVQDGRPWIATTLVPDGSLSELLREGPLDVATATELVAQVASGVAAAHAVGVLHRDIKPSNVLVRRTAGGLEAVVCDLGIAHETDAEHTRTGGVIGTWAYLAPERLEGADATVASDVYALGCLLHAALTGRAPYGGTEAQVAMAHVQAPVPTLSPGLGTPALQGVVTRAMAKRPEDRPPSAAAVADALRAAAADPAAPDTPTGAGAPPTGALFARSAARPPRIPEPAEQSRVTAQVPRRAVVPRRRRGGLVAALVALGVLVLVGALVVPRVLGGDDTPDTRGGTTVTDDPPATRGAEDPGVAEESFVDDPAGGLRVGGEVGEQVVLEVTGDTLPTGAATLVAGSGPALAAGQQVLVDFWVGDAQGTPLTDTYAARLPVVLPVEQGVAPYLDPLVEAGVGTRYRYGASVQDAFGGPEYAEQLGVAATDPVVVVVDVVGSVLAAPQGTRQPLPPGAPLVRRGGGRITGFTFLPGDGAPPDPLVSYVVRGDGRPLVRGDDVALRSLVQDVGAEEPTADGYDDPLPAAISLDTERGSSPLGDALVGVTIGSQVVVQLPGSATTRPTATLVDVLGAG